MIEIRVPDEQEGTKAVVRGWLKRIGDRVRENDPLVELETDKVTQEVPAPADGVLAEILLDTDAEAQPGALLGRLSNGEGPLPKIGERPDDTAKTHEAEVDGPVAADEADDDRENGARVDDRADRARIETRLSPSVRRAVRDHGVDPRGIAGTGKGGRVTRADVDAFVAGGGVKRGASTPARKLESKTVPHDRMRKAIAENLTASVRDAPHVTAVFECDMSAIIAHRKAHKAAYQKAGARLTLTAYFVKAAADAMRAVPEINSRWHADRLELFGQVNIGVGTALGDKGLVVPVVHGAQALDLKAIAARLEDLTSRARADKLGPSDMRGGTFSISNHGVSGSLFASPIIIVQPQAAILGIGKTEKRVVVREVDGVDTIQVRPMAYVSLTIDHRVIDGHQTNAWLSKFVEVIEGWPPELDADR